MLRSILSYRHLFPVSLTLLALSVQMAMAQTTAFTYEGRLNDNGQPANGNYDLEFRLYDAASGGSQQGATIQRLDVAVNNGVYTVILDFGAAVFTGEDRFLEVGSRLAGSSDPFTPSLPRPQITSTPYSIRSLSAADATNAANATNATNAANAMNAAQLNTTGGSNSFFGLFVGGANTTGSRNSFFGNNAGLANTTGDRNSFFGYRAGDSNTTGSDNTIIGNTADVGSDNLTFATAIGAGAIVNTSDTIVLGRSVDAVAVRGDLYAHNSVVVNGTLRVVTLSSAGSTNLCRNSSDRISTCSSSLRYKTDVQPFIGGLNLVSRLRPIIFKWRDGGMHDVGFGAEDVETVEPLLVTYNDKGEIEGVKYGQFTTVLVNAVTELKQENEGLKAHLKQQQQQVEALRKLVCSQNPQADLCK